MANTYYDSQLTAAEIEAALEAINGVIIPANNGKVLAISNGKIEARSVQWGGGEAVLEPLSVTQNGTYTPPSGVDGYAPVTVNVQGGASDNDFLFHFDDGFRNSGSYPAIFISTKGLEISNEQSKFGGHSLKCGLSQLYNNVALECDFAFGSDDFTLDFWMYPTNLSTGSTTQTPLSFTYRSLAIYISQTQCSVNFAYTNSTWGTTAAVTNINIPLNEWHHVAIVRNGEEVFLFLNGIKKATANVGENSIAPITAMTVGSNTYSSGNRTFQGYIDELRLKIGEAVWTSDFTPPTQPYT